MALFGGSAAWLGAAVQVPGMEAKARAQFSKAKGAAHGIPWLVALARYQHVDTAPEFDNAGVMEQLERVEAVLAQLGTTHDQSFAKREKEILGGLGKEKGPFEQAHKLLGELLG